MTEATGILYHIMSYWEQVLPFSPTCAIIASAAGGENRVGGASVKLPRSLLQRAYRQRICGEIPLKEALWAGCG